MAEPARQTLTSAAVSLEVAPPPAFFLLRGRAEDARFDDAMHGALGLHLPIAPNTVVAVGGLTVLWTGPTRWLVHAPSERGAGLHADLDRALAGTGGTCAELSDAKTLFVVSGREARALLAKGCGLDLHPRAFVTGRCALTLFAQLTVLLHQISDAPAFALIVDRAAASYCWEWLLEAAREFGITATA